MDEALALCRRVLGEDYIAQQAAAEARAGGGEDRVGVLAAAVRVCRERFGGGDMVVPPPGEGGDSLNAAVAHEIALATSQLSEAEREALALRELLRLSYDELSRVVGIDEAAVAPLLAHARLHLRAARRGPIEPPEGGVCAESERGLAVLARRQDSEPIGAEDDEWLLAHLARCQSCERAHAAMLEASVCYRAWT